MGLLSNGIKYQLVMAARESDRHTSYVIYKAVKDKDKRNKLMGIIKFASDEALGYVSGDLGDNNKYNVVEYLGTGRTSDVYRATGEEHDDGQSEQLYFVVKIYKEDAHARAEVDLLAGIHTDTMCNCGCQHIPRYVENNRTPGSNGSNGRDFLVVKEYGTPLMKFFYTRADDTPDEAQPLRRTAFNPEKMASGVLAALKYTHTRGHVHGDVALGNLYVTKGAHLYIHIYICVCVCAWGGGGGGGENWCLCAPSRCDAFRYHTGTFFCVCLCIALKLRLEGGSSDVRLSPLTLCLCACVCACVVPISVHADGFVLNDWSASVDLLDKDPKHADHGPIATASPRIVAAILSGIGARDVIPNVCDDLASLVLVFELVFRIRDVSFSESRRMGRERASEGGVEGREGEEEGEREREREIVCTLVFDFYAVVCMLHKKMENENA